MEARHDLVITLGDKEANYESAYKLGRAFYNHENISVESFESDTENFFTNIPDNQLKEIVFLGHGNRQQYDKHSAASFAKRFDDLFTRSRAPRKGAALKESKQTVNHVYLVGCELGLIDHKGKSLAQSIASELYKKGYKKVVVHAYAAVQANPDDSLIVKVITREGAQVLISLLSELAGGADDKPMFKEGYLAAELINEKSKASHLLLGGAAPRQELNRPANTFGHKPESLTSRIERINEENVANEIQTRAQAIALLHQRSSYLQFIAQTNPLKEAANKPRIVTLTKYVMKLNSAAHKSKEEWKAVLLEILASVRQSPLFKRGGNTEKLVLALSNRNDLRVSELTAQQAERESLVRSSELKKTPPVKTKVSAISAINIDIEEQPQTTITQPQNSLSRALQNEIANLITTLDDEIKAMNSTCFSFFKSYEINTKIEKHNLLNQFFDQHNDGIGVTRDQAHAIAWAASQNERVMRSKKTRRTHDLINKILAETKDLAVRPNEDTAINSSLLDKKLR